MTAAPGARFPNDVEEGSQVANREWQKLTEQNGRSWATLNSCPMRRRTRFDALPFALNCKLGE
ncbi:hypothetical protein FA13DRAFT_1738346 [Coprinellus micaceus]|uniref:Uncharacterized protein n=1 Tax=Coprinellus micaceus TaxID=71717 RepID=A0A4Y7SU71_COPMI|nr:hypothetical protein FA13DRAFT_1738346 [Coprinellus micaceus]